MNDKVFDDVVSRGATVLSLNDRFSRVLQAQVLYNMKREPHVEGVCCEVEVENCSKSSFYGPDRTVVIRKSVKQRLGRVHPGVQLDPGPQRVGPDPRRSGRCLSSGALEGRFLGGRRCPCALWGLRLLSRRYGWAGRVLRARPLKRIGFTPNSSRQAKAPTKEELDQQLDDYMSMSNRYLDAQLDHYNAMAADQDEKDVRKWFGDDVV